MAKPAIIRAQHWTDEEIGEGQRKRTLRNWINYKNQAGEWNETNQVMRDALPGETITVGGHTLPLIYVADAAPLEFFIGDSAVTFDRPWWGFRLSHDPSTACVFFVDEAKPGNIPAPNYSGLSATWTGLLKDTDLTLFAGPNVVEKWFSLLTKRAGISNLGTTAPLGVVLPAGWTLEVNNPGTPGNTIAINDGTGALVYTSRPAQAFDANEVAVPCEIVDNGAANLGGVLDYRSLRVVCDPTGATYPILMDPTVTISGTTDIEDATLIDQTPDTNYGALNRVQFGLYGAIATNTLRRAVFRINESSIPAGVITGFTLECTRLAEATGSVNAANAVAHRILPANDWVEGTATAAVQTGSVCWNYAKYATQAWAGSGGCSTSGTDYEADASPPTTYYPGYASGPDVAFSFTLDPAWCEGWRDADYANEGFVLFSEVITATNAYMFQMYSSEDATNPLTFEIEYSEPVAGLSSATRAPTVGRLWAPYRLPGVGMM